MLLQMAASGMKMGLALPTFIWAGIAGCFATAFTKFLHSELANKPASETHELEQELKTKSQAKQRAAIELNPARSEDADRSVFATLCSLS